MISKNNIIEVPSLIHVGSEASMSGTTNQFVWLFDPAIRGDVCKISLLSAKIPLVAYNITADNNSFQIYNATMGSSPPISLGIVPGAYDVNTLTTALATAINAVSGTTSNITTVTYNPTTLKITFTNSQPSTQLFFTGAISRILGFSAGVYGPSAVITSTGVVDMSVADYLYIKIIGLNSPSTGLFSNQDCGITYILPTFGNIGTVLYHVANSTFYQTIKNDSPVRSVTIELRTANGKLYDLQGLNWGFVLGLTYEL